MFNRIHGFLAVMLLVGSVLIQFYGYPRDTHHQPDHDDLFQNRMDEALIEWTDDQVPFELFQKHVDCFNCNYDIKQIDDNHKAFINIHNDYLFKIINTNIECKLSSFEMNEFSIYRLTIDKPIGQCYLSLTDKPHKDSKLYLYIALICVLVFCTLFSFFGSSGNDATHAKPRLQSLDTFRGLNLFLMVFVNYGSGGYRILQHKPWHGVTIADFVFPWFLWIMGVSIGIGIGTTSTASKILHKFFKLFFIGIMLNTRFGVQISDIRVMGVLQRIAICYLVVSFLNLIFYKKPRNTRSGNFLACFIHDAYKSLSEWAFIATLIGLWFCVVFYLPVPGCPLGYMGPGGVDNYSAYFNCTGGATAYVDHVVLGVRHMYQRPTCRSVYKTVKAFDPEGILGTVNAIVLTFLGVQIGRILQNYKSTGDHLKQLFLWSIGSLALFHCFCFNGLLDGGQSCFIPVNKNLWTPTYTFLMSFYSCSIFACLYYIVDVRCTWSGQPFTYLGMNSILFYILHVLFSTTFPIQFIVSHTHLHQLAMDLWGSFVWTLVATYLYKKNIFFNL